MIADILSYSVGGLFILWTVFWCMCLHAKLLICVQLFATPWTVVHQAPLSMGFSRQEYWNGLPCPPPGDLPDSGIKPTSLISTRTGRQALYYYHHLGSPTGKKMKEWVVITRSDWDLKLQLPTSRSHFCFHPYPLAYLHCTLNKTETPCQGE